MPYVTVDLRYESIGSGGGKSRIKGLTAPYVHYAGSDSVLTAEEMKEYPDLKMVQAVAGAVVLSFNIPGVQDLVLSLDIAAGIYNGTIVYWDDTSIQTLNPSTTLPNERIIPIARSEKSGTTNTFTSGLSSASEDWRNTYGIFSEGYDRESRLPYKWNSSVVKFFGRTNQGVSGLVLSLDYSITYISLSDANLTQLNYAMLENSQGNIVNASYQSVQRAIVSSYGSYNLINLQEPFVYPLSTYSFFIIRMSTMEDCDSAIELIRYIVWFTSSEKAAYDAEQFSMVALEQTTATLVATNILQKVTCEGQNAWNLMLEQIKSESTFKEESIWTIFTYIGISSVVTVFVISLGIYIKYEYNVHKEILNDSWNIPPQSIKLHGLTAVHYHTSEGQRISHTSVEINNSGNSDVRLKFHKQFDSDTIMKSGTFNDENVTLVQVERLDLAFTFRQKKKVIWLRNTIKHDHVMTLLGMTKLNGLWHSLHSGFSRGTLNDILRNPKFKFQNKAFISVVKDLSKALKYLHGKNIIHGFLSGKCCFLDRYWMVKIAAWNENSIHEDSRKAQNYAKVSTLLDSNNEGADEKLLFVAPEKIKYGKQSTTSGDIYSLGMVFQEIFSRNKPFNELNLRASEIVNAVITCGIRPRISSTTPSEIQHLMEKCWEVDPSVRPNAHQIETILCKEFPDSVSFLDCMTNTLEKYAANLESNTADLETEYKFAKSQAQTYMYANVPESVANHLMQQKKIKTCTFDDLCLLTCAITNIAETVRHVTPDGFVNLLHSFYIGLDQLLLHDNMFRIQRTADMSVYVVGNVIDETVIFDTREAKVTAVNIASKIVVFKDKFNVENLQGINTCVQLKLCICSGSGSTGVLKSVIPQFIAFGQVVDKARILIGSVDTNKVQISKSVAEVLTHVPGINVKVTTNEIKESCYFLQPPGQKYSDLPPVDG
ncbi:atrial natriuretic peptide receptor 2-like [Mya arenaria]|uniref:atrial natriuretic peptide receptor 2-like n=1 Tax=Mya arenaria TaxID=6604 RepID=UPI0022E57219|nr:atrial natriuretic peptide receptor 2-like [Mya arenaria]